MNFDILEFELCRGHFNLNFSGQTYNLSSAPQRQGFYHQTHKFQINLKFMRLVVNLKIRAKIIVKIILALMWTCQTLIKATKFFLEVLALLDVRHQSKLNPLSRKTKETTLRKWQKPSFVPNFGLENLFCGFCLYLFEIVPSYYPM